MEAGSWQLTSSNASMKQKEVACDGNSQSHPSDVLPPGKAAPPEALEQHRQLGAMRSGVCLWETVLTHTVTLALVSK